MPIAWQNAGFPAIQDCAGLAVAAPLAETLALDRPLAATSATAEVHLARVVFGSNLQKHLPRPILVAEGATVGQALASVFDPDPLLRSYVLDDQGRLRKHVNVFLNNTPIKDRVRLGDRCQPNDEIYIFQALSGG